MDNNLIDKYWAAIRRWEERGKPEVSGEIRAALDADEALPKKVEQELVFDVPTDVVDSFDFAPADQTPPRKGQGSGDKAWREFAREFSDIDDELIDELNKKDLIQMLEVNNVIPSA